MGLHPIPFLLRLVCAMVNIVSRCRTVCFHRVGCDLVLVLWYILNDLATLYLFILKVSF